MRTNILRNTFIVLSFAVLLFACGHKEKEIAKPQIILTEVGHDNCKTVQCGKDLHLEANIVAEGIIERIDVEIHQEKEGGREIEKSFTTGKYIGVKNTLFHEHIDIPSDMPTGEYHLHFKVTDKEKQTSTKEVHITVTENDGKEEHHHDRKDK